MRSRDEALSRLSMRNPWHLLATGFGSGLSPVVPGTMGSLAAIPFWYLMTFLPWQLYSLVVMMSICIGVYLCHRTAKDMGTHDHGSIVWDEFRRDVDHPDGAADPGLAVGGRRLRDFPYLRYVEAVANSLV